MLDFTAQTADEVFRTVKALHPFLPCYITHKHHFFVVNPYKVTILEEEYSDKNPNDIIAKSVDEKSLTIVCKDNKAVKFDDLKLYGMSVWTKFYIKHRVKL